ncbi:hypothetical protein DPM19_19850 [Actinomadura craniellae]|uniref:Tetratricopeptide repeat protein n=1 Tax=Actinomadura craniellae TaxID=2231787 RepID=A0A365H3C9_9ACTN|nr:hypothetical protein [Actinomadura craniellae]RAY13528.1 hypothetical protein DPM19_19850 [Actinomadura craniellae]
MPFPVRKATTALAVVAMVAGLTAFSTVAFGRGFEDPPPAPVPAAALDRISGADLGRTIGRLQERLRARPDDADSWSTLGLAHVEQARLTADPSHYPRAENALRRALRLRPAGDEQVRTGLAALAAARHDFPAALREADLALAVNPYGTRAHAVRVDALVELGRYDEAWAAVRRADSLRPGIPIFTRYAHVLELRGDPGRARQVLERAAESATDRTDVAYVAAQLGDLAWSRGDLAAAGRHHAAALRADPSSLAALDGRARVRAARGDAAGALADRTALAGRAPLPGYVAALGELHEAQGRPDRAREQYAVMDAWQALARTNGVGTDLETALLGADHGAKAAALQAARAEWSRRRSIHVADALAWALHVNGRDREALPYARQAARTGFRDARFLYHRGMIERSLGRTADARRSLTAALRLNPHFSPLDAPKARAALKELS